MKKLISALMSLSLLAGVAAMPVSAAETYSLGDVDMNGKVELMDVALTLHEFLIQRFFDGRQIDNVPLLTEEQNKYADVDVDGQVRHFDALMILQYYVYTLVTAEPMSSEAFFADFPDSADYDIADEVVDRVTDDLDDMSTGGVNDPF